MSLTSTIKPIIIYIFYKLFINSLMVNYREDRARYWKAGVGAIMGPWASAYMNVLSNTGSSLYSPGTFILRM